MICSFSLFPSRLSVPRIRDRIVHHGTTYISYGTYISQHHHDNIKSTTTNNLSPPFLCFSVFEVTTRYVDLQPVGMGAFGLVCSAKDQLTGQSVAVKKIMKPFSTPVLAKRTYRELKLLKHIRHENIISLSDIFISPLEDIYFVTELLGTDLHRLLTSRPLEKQFIQYFLYQILVSHRISERASASERGSFHSASQGAIASITGYAVYAGYPSV